MDVIAHRGARRLAVENTVEALRVAYEEGADGVEFDIQLSSDGELFAFHDDDLGQWTGQAIPVTMMSWRDLRCLELRDRYGHSGRISHFDEVVELVTLRGGLVNAELKVAPGKSESAIRLADAMGQRLQAIDRRRWLVSCFDRSTLERLQSQGLEIGLAALLDDDPDCSWWSLAENDDAGADIETDAGGLQAVHPHGLVATESRCRRWRRADLRVHPWTINEPRHWEHFLQMAVDGLISDDPGGLRRHIDRAGYKR